jgi:hypothetical protein
MMLNKPKMQIFPTLIAVLSLFVSAVSACACSHHEPVKPAVESSSCHGPTHEQQKEAVVENAPEGAHLEADCNCFVKTPVPGIIAKTDDKRVGTEKRFDEPLIMSTAFVPVLTAAASPPPEFDPPDHGYKTALLSALPSRAPPLL